MRSLLTVSARWQWLPLVAALAAGVAAPAAEFLPGVKRVVFLGDSITYAGGYIETIEAYARTRFPGRAIEFLNLGLPSETTSGLSEPGHAGGKFPRPDVHERLGRVLEKTRPDLVVACYGMNDGIYHPFSEERFAKYRAGIMRLRERCAAAGAKVLHVTPPVFDPVPIHGKTLPAGLPEYRQPFEGYNAVLDRYADWLLAQRQAGWEVVDLHGLMNKFLTEQRAKDPAFKLANDGVHMNATGHWLAAKAILTHWGATDLAKVNDATAMLSNHKNGAQVLALVQQRQRLLKDAWLRETRHLRPGMKEGLPLEEAKTKAAELERQIIRSLHH
jgi:lysophospholipase L1-like esterase